MDSSGDTCSSPDVTVAILLSIVDDFNESNMRRAKTQKV